MTAPRRGEVWLVDLGMAAKVRPAVVVSVPATVPVPFLKVGVFDAQNIVTIPHAKLVRHLGTLGKAQFGIVERAMCLWLGLPSSGADRPGPTS
jgi:mRNA interferase MazF